MNRAGLRHGTGEETVNPPVPSFDRDDARAHVLQPRPGLGGGKAADLQPAQFRQAQLPRPIVHQITGNVLAGRLLTRIEFHDAFIRAESPNGLRSVLQMKIFRRFKPEAEAGMQKLPASDHAFFGPIPVKQPVNGLQMRSRIYLACTLRHTGLGGKAGSFSYPRIVCRMGCQPIDLHGAGPAARKFGGERRFRGKLFQKTCLRIRIVSGPRQIAHAKTVRLKLLLARIAGKQALAAQIEKLIDRRASHHRAEQRAENLRADGGGLTLGTVTGGDAADILTGQGGNDILNGGGGADVILDAGGSNVVNSGSGPDKVGLLSGDNTVNGGEGNDLIVGGYDNDTLNGDAGNDVIIGDVSTNIAGADRIAGGADNDLLEGRGGADTFVFTARSGWDSVHDYEDGTDMLSITFAGQSFDTLDIQQEGADVSIWYGSGGIVLEDTDAALLDADDFLFA